MSRKGLLLFLAAGLFWGMPYFFIKIAGEEFATTSIIFARVVIGAAVLIPLALYRKTGSVKPGKIGGHVPPKIRGPHREWVLQQIEAGGDVTLQGLADGLAGRGLKVDYRTMWNFVHREGKRFKKNRVWV